MPAQNRSVIRVIPILLGTVVVVSACASRKEAIVLSPYGTWTGVGGRGLRLRQHDGVDIKADATIRASADGIVSWIRTENLHHGSTIAIFSSSLQRWITYSHLKTTFVLPDEAVLKGRPIGEVGLFRSSGGIVHVHWRICVDQSCKRTEDPMKYNPVCSAAKSSDVLFPVRC